MPVIEGLRREAPEAVLSVDTRKAPVAAASIDAGADVVNDVGAGASLPRCSRWSRRPAPVGPDAHARRAQDDAGGSRLRRRRGGGACVPRGASIGRRAAWDPKTASRSTRDRVRQGPPAQPRVAAIDRFVPRARRPRRRGRVAEASSASCRARRTRRTVSRVRSPRPWCATQGVDVVRVHDVGPTVRALRSPTRSSGVGRERRPADRARSCTTTAAARPVARLRPLFESRFRRGAGPHGRRQRRTAGAGARGARGRAMRGDRPRRRRRAARAGARRRRHRGRDGPARRAGRGRRDPGTLAGFDSPSCSCGGRTTTSSRRGRRGAERRDPDVHARRRPRLRP